MGSNNTKLENPRALMTDKGAVRMIIPVIGWTIKIKLWNFNTRLILWLWVDVMMLYPKFEVGMTSEAKAPAKFSNYKRLKLRSSNWLQILKVFFQNLCILISEWACNTLRLTLCRGFECLTWREKMIKLSQWGTF